LIPVLERIAAALERIADIEEIDQKPIDDDFDVYE
jgi:hypothetical protein